MPEDKEPAVDALLKDSERLLGHVEDAERLIADLPDQTVADINSQMRRNELESLNRTLGLQVDARVDIHVSIDDMLSTGDFFPPVAGGKRLDLSDIEELLASRNIVYGVKWDIVRDAIYRCNTEGVEIDSVVIAEGKAPIAETPAHLLINRRFLEPPPPPKAQDGRVEHKERSPFILVEEGELLAKRVPGQKGESGWTVYGKELAPQKRAIPVLTPGENTRESGDGIFAACAGRFVLARRTFSISPVLEVSGDVDYSTGHLDFDGDIVIHGDVQDGFNIKATGSVHCERTLSASQVECGGDLIINRGIIGRQKGEIRVQGHVRCKYIEHCYLEAKGTITTMVGMMNSVVNTNDRFETGPRGIIVGGKLFAQNGVSATQIGTSMGPATEVYCGVDYSVLRRLEWIRDRNMELATKLNEVRRRITASGDPSGKLQGLEKQLQEAVRKLNTASVSLVGHLDKNENATVVVRDAIYPNTYIEICHTSFVVGRIMRAVAFKLDRERGKIVAEPIR